jgi:hypothetical protein
MPEHRGVLALRWGPMVFSHKPTFSDTLVRSSSLFIKEEKIMKFCVEVNGVKHCWWVPVYEVQWQHIPDPGPEYTHVLTDATILGTIRSLANQLVSAEAKEALHSGLNQSLKAVQSQAGKGVSISFAH